MPAASTFIGRDDERAHLRERIESRRMVTLLGPGGMGKTRLAVETCADLAGAFPGGIRLCELSQIEPRDEIGAEVAGQLGFASVEALAVGVGGGEERGLLVVDNCEHVLAAAARLCARLLDAAPSLHLLATSREPLGIDGEHVLLLGPLALPSTADAADVAAAAATRLFADRAQAAGAAEEDSQAQLAAIVDLCRRLDGVPLAIELAAARARSLTAVELLARLDRRFDLLQRSSPIGRSRHRSLRAAIDTSYDLLEPGEQALFRALGVFVGPFAAELAHAVAGRGEHDLLDTLDTLGRLVDRSLLITEQQAGTTRYRLLDSLRHYAAEQAVTAGEWDVMTDRFVEAMVAEADRIVASGLARWSPQVLGAALTQLGNLIAAVDRCIASEASAERAFRLLLPMWGGIHQGRAGEVAAACERVLARWPDGDEPLRAVASAVAAMAHLVDGRIERSRELARLVLSRTPEVSLAGVMALRALAIAARNEGEEVGARELFRRARDAASAAGISAFEIELSTFVHSWVPADEDLDGALAALAEVARRAHDDGDAVGEVWAQLVSAHLLLGAGRLEAAQGALAVAEEVLRGFEYPYGTIVLLRLRATLVSLESGWSEARAAWLAAIDRSAASGALPELAHTLRTAAAVALRADDSHAAVMLRDAVPHGVHVAVLPGLLEEELHVLASTPSARAASPADALRRVRSLLSDRTPAPAGARAGVVARAASDTRAADEPIARSQADDDRALFRREGDVWRVEFARATAHVKHSRGIADLAVLLANPGQEIHSLDLMNGSVGATTEGPVSGDPILDRQAVADYRRRLALLDEAIAEAEAAGVAERGATLEEERDVLLRELRVATGIGGRARGLKPPDERARKAVSSRIRDGIARLRAVHPELGRHLDESVRTGIFCSYAPGESIHWRT